MVSKTNKFYFNCTSYKLVPVCTVLLVISAERFSTEISDQNLQVPDSQHWWKLQDFDITIERERGQMLNKKLMCHNMRSGDLKKHDFSCRGQKKALDDDMAQISNKISLLSGPDKNPCEGLKWVFSLYGGQNVWDSRFVPPPHGIPVTWVCTCIIYTVYSRDMGLTMRSGSESTNNDDSTSEISIENKSKYIGWMNAFH